MRTFLRRPATQALLLALLLIVTVPPLARLCQGRSPSRFETANLPVWERRPPRPAPPKVMLRAVPLPPGAVQWDAAPWLRTLRGADENHLLAPLEFPAPASAVHAGDAGRWLEAAAALGRTDAAFAAKQDRVALRLMNAQDNDGYLAAGQDKGRWSLPQTRNFSRNLRGLLAYYGASHHTAAIYAAMAAGNLAASTPDLNAPARDAPHSAPQTMSPLVLPMARLYMLTGETRYRRWALRAASAGQTDGAGWCALYVATGQHAYLQNAVHLWKLGQHQGQTDPDLAASLLVITGAPGYADAAVTRTASPPWPCPLLPGTLICTHAGRVLSLYGGGNWHAAFAGARVTQKITGNHALLTVSVRRPALFTVAWPRLAPGTSASAGGQTLSPGPAGLRVMRLWKNGDTVRWMLPPVKALPGPAPRAPRSATPAPRAAARH